MTSNGAEMSCRVTALGTLLRRRNIIPIVEGCLTRALFNAVTMPGEGRGSRKFPTIKIKPNVGRRGLDRERFSGAFDKSGQISKLIQ